MYKGIHFGGIILGVVFDNVVSLALYWVLSLGYALYGGAQGMTSEGIAQGLQNSDTLQVIGFGLGTGVSLLAGFLTAWLAKSHEMTNAAVMSFLDIIVVLSLGYLLQDTTPFWLIAASCGCTIVVALAAGLVWKGIRQLKPTW